MRVSTTEQKLDRQEVALSQLGIDRYFREKISEKKRRRPELSYIMEYVRDGDCLNVESISRLGRYLQDLFDIVNELNRKGVGLISCMA